MSWMKLAIPIAVGALAAFLNWQILTSKAPARTFVRVKEPVRAGSVLVEDNLEKVELSGNDETLGQLVLAAVPWKDRGVALGRPVVRDLKGNDLVLWSDVTSARLPLRDPSVPISLEDLKVVPAVFQVDDRVSFVIARANAGSGGPPSRVVSLFGIPLVLALPAPAEFDTVGPFRVVGVGDLTARQTPDSKEARGQGERIIHLAVKLGENGKIAPDDPILAVIAAQRREAGSEPRLRNVVIHPRDATPAAKKP